MHQSKSKTIILFKQHIFPHQREIYINSPSGLGTKDCVKPILLTLPRFTILKQPLMLNVILKAFIEKSNMETTACHIQFCLTSSFLTQWVPSWYLPWSKLAVVPGPMLEFITNSYRHGHSARMSDAHPASSVPNQVSVVSDQRDVNQCMCRTCLLSMGRDAELYQHLSQQPLIWISSLKLTAQLTSWQQKRWREGGKEGRGHYLIHMKWNLSECDNALHYRSIFEEDGRLTKYFLIYQNLICLS